MAILLTVLQNRDVAYVDCKEYCVGCSLQLYIFNNKDSHVGMLFYIVLSAIPDLS